MCTYYVLYDPTARLFAAVGHTAGTTWSMNRAKHFTSPWSAENWQRKSDVFQSFIVKKIQHS